MSLIDSGDFLRIVAILAFVGIRVTRSFWMSASVDTGRRSFLRGRARGAPLPVRPPWAVPESKFVDLCSRCDECVKVCGEFVLRRGSGGYPEADFRSGACTFCGECARNCPGNVLRVDQPRASAWDQPRVEVSSTCLARQGTVCRACGDACEARALRFRLALGGRSEPIPDPLRCTGCGACVYVCPVEAVIVKSNQEIRA